MPKRSSASLDIDIVIDHFGRVAGRRRREAPAFQTLLRAREARQRLGEADRAVLPVRKRAALRGRDAVRAGGGRRCAGPHGVGHRLAASRGRRGCGVPMPNDGDLADLDAGVDTGRSAVRKQVLVDNPARLYQF